ncbi:hypothetical protein BH09PAT1_BH09PAT1_7890 [soil metagenome]
MSQLKNNTEVENNIINLYTSGLSFSQVGKKVDKNATYVGRVLKRHGTTIRYSGKEHFGSRKSTSLRDKKVTPEILNIINGLLLGDGSISKDGRLILGTVSKEYIEFTSRQLNNCGIETRIYSQNHKQSWGNSPIWYLSTKTIPILNSIYDKWYGDGKKRKIPSDLVLSQSALLHMYIGDGSLSKVSKYIQISTHCFSFTSLNLLQHLLKEKNIVSSILSAGEGKGYTINIYGVSCQNFLDYIGVCPVEDYRYKWKLHKYKTSRVSWYIGARMAEIIRQKHIKGKSQIELAKFYNISPSTVCNIVNNRVYKKGDI